MQFLGVFPYKSFVPGSESYFVGPETAGPAVTVAASRDHKNRFTRFVRQTSTVFVDYERPPRPDEEFAQWFKRAKANDLSSLEAERQLKERLATDGRPVVRYSLEISPPLKDPRDIQRAAGVLGRQLLDSYKNPDALQRIVPDLVAEGVPFDSMNIRIEVLSNELAQRNPYI